MASTIALRVGVSAILMLLTGTVSAAQDGSARVTGVVRDAAGTPLANVNVRVVSGADGRTAVTDVSGQFTIDNLAAGEYALTTSGAQLREATRIVQLPAGGVTELALDVERIHSETIVVTAARGDVSLLDVDASVSVIGSSEITASPATQVPDLLRQVPGLNVVQFGSRDFEVNSRSSSGILANSTLVLVDGRSVFQPLYGAVYWDLMTVAPHDIGQIEVLRSPASAMWGSNALNGVINIRTKSPRQLPGLRGEVSAGNRGTRSGNVSWADSTERLSYKLSASYFEQDAWPRDNRLPDGSQMPRVVLFENRGTHQPKIDLRIDWDGDARRVWSLRGGAAGAHGLIHSALGPGEFAPESFASYLELNRHTDRSDLKFYWNRLDAPFEIVLYGFPEDATNDTLVADVTRRFDVGDRHRVTAGGALRVDRFAVTIAPDDTRRVEAGSFVEDRITVTRHLRVSLGGRVDKFDTTGAVFAPRVGAVVSPSLKHAFRAAYNRAYRAPSLLENFVNVTLPAVVPLDPPFVYPELSIGSTALDMERQDAFEIGYTGVLPARTTVFATVYRQQISDNIWFLPVSFYGPGAAPAGWPLDPSRFPVLPRTYSFVNLGKLRDRGLELAAHIDVSAVTIRTSYTFQDLPTLEDALPGVTLPINRPPRHQGSAALTFSRGPWTAEGDLHYTARAFWADVFTQPFWGYTRAYHSLNARGSFQLPGRQWTLWLSATNMLDASIKSHVYGDTIGRTVTAGLRWQVKP